MIPHQERKSPGSTDGQHRMRIYDRTGSFLTMFVYLLLLCTAMVFAKRYAFNWLYIDDINTIQWLQRIKAGQLGFLGLLDVWNNQHPLGGQIALIWAMTSLFGFSLKNVVFASFWSIVLAAFILAWTVGAAINDRRRRGILWVTLLPVAFHPTQMEHLLWAFEIGWFVINLIIVANACAIESYRNRALPFVFAGCLFASFCSAQGSFTWLAVALHCSLYRDLPARRTWTMLFAFAGVAACARIALRDTGDAGAAPLRIGQAGDFAVYCLQLLGGASGSQDHRVLLLSGTALAIVTLILLGWTVRGRVGACDRLGFSMIFASMLTVLGFAKGRFDLGIDWAIFSFHAAPLLVPFYFGLITLAVSALDKSPERPWRSYLVSVTPVLILLAGFCYALPYGAKRARLWAMDRGYAMWVTCDTEVPIDLQAAAAGLPNYVDAFRDGLPMVRQMCATRPDGLTGRLVAMPSLFAAMIATRPEYKPALEALWQAYAIDVGLQLFLDVDVEDTPQRLLEFAKASAKAGSTYRPSTLKPYEHLFLQM